MRRKHRSDRPGYSTWGPDRSSIVPFIQHQTLKIRLPPIQPFTWTIRAYPKNKFHDISHGSRLISPSVFEKITGCTPFMHHYLMVYSIYIYTSQRPLGNRRNSGVSSQKWKRRSRTERYHVIRLQIWRACLERRPIIVSVDVRLWASGIYTQVRSWVKKVITGTYWTGRNTECRSSDRLRWCCTDRYSSSLNSLDGD